MTMRNMLGRVVSVVGLVWCGIAAQSASAIPLQIDITSTANASAAGLWTLTGPTVDGGLWAVGPGGSYSDTANVGTGDYTWTIAGAGVNLGDDAGVISWTLSFAGSQISGSATGDWLIKVLDQTKFEVGRPVSVPEPGTLSLLGLGLVGVALSVRRRGRRAA